MGGRHRSLMPPGDSEARIAAGTSLIATPAVLVSALRGGLVYAGAAAFQRGLVFLLLPVYTHVLDPPAYGQLSILLAIATAAIILLSIGMDMAFFRSYFLLRGDADRQQSLVTTAWLFLLVAAPVGAAALALTASPFLAHSEIVPPGELALALAGAALFVSGTVVPLAALRAEERLRDYMILTFLLGASTAGFTFLGVFVLERGVTGWFVAVIAANAVTLLAAMRLVPLRFSGGFDRGLLAGALTFGLPLMPHSLAHWGLGVSNRLLLAGLVPPFQVGVYALAANIALPVAILMQGMAQGFMPAYARAATDKAALDSLPRMINVQFLLVLTIATAATLIGPIATHVLAPPAYAPAADLVPWLTGGYALLGLYFLPMNAVALTAGRTRRIWMITFVAAGTNLAAVTLLVPSLGLTGAAVAVMVGYATLLVGVGLYSRANNPVRYDWPLMTRAAIVFACVYVAALASSGDRTLLDAGIRTCWLVAALPLLVLARVVDRAQIAALLRTVSVRARPIE